MIVPGVLLACVDVSWSDETVVAPAVATPSAVVPVTLREPEVVAPVTFRAPFTLKSPGVLTFDTTDPPESDVTVFPPTLRVLNDADDAKMRPVTTLSVLTCVNL